MGIRYDLVAIMLVLFGAGMLVGSRLRKEIAYMVFGVGLLLGGVFVIETEDWFLRFLFILIGAIIAIFHANTLLFKRMEDKNQTNDQNKN